MQLSSSTSSVSERAPNAVGFNWQEKQLGATDYLAFVFPLLLRLPLVKHFFHVDLHVSNIYDICRIGVSHCVPTNWTPSHL